MEPSTREAIAAGLDASSEAPPPLALGDLDQTGVSGGPAPAPMELEGLEAAGAGEEAPPPAPLDHLDQQVGVRVSGETELPPSPGLLEAEALEEQGVADVAPPPSPMQGPVGEHHGYEAAAATEEPPPPVSLDELERLERGG